eukprot:GGOE01046425.1.p1 GENE.GGOE01046425.1~~GGOE01046425.1.p1  ORF type:complete len:359 (+),score=68.07 GGOE01046425.1:42-1118(+)
MALFECVLMDGENVHFPAGDLWGNEVDFHAAIKKEECVIKEEPEEIELDCFNNEIWPENGSDYGVHQPLQANPFRCHTLTKGTPSLDLSSDGAPSDTSSAKGSLEMTLPTFCHTSPVKANGPLQIQRAPQARNWIGQHTDRDVSVEIYIKNSRQRVQEYIPHIPAEMYSHPYMNNIRIVVSMRTPKSSMPWGEGPCRYTLRLVEADTLIGDRLTRALAGDGVSGQLQADLNLPFQVLQKEGRFWIEKGYISYHFHNKQFRIVALLHSDSNVWATFVSAPFTILAKRKERLHGYNALSAKWKRAANMEARRQSKALSLAAAMGLTDEETRQADEALLRLTGLKTNQQQYIMQLWANVSF